MVRELNCLMKERDDSYLYLDQCKKEAKEYVDLWYPHDGKECFYIYLRRYTGRVVYLMRKKLGLYAGDWNVL